MELSRISISFLSRETSSLTVEIRFSKTLNVDAKRLTEAEDWIKKAIEADTRNGTRFSLAQDFAQYAELCKRKGDLAMAKEKLSKAIEIFKECGADGWVKKYEEELAKL